MPPPMSPLQAANFLTNVTVTMPNAIGGGLEKSAKLVKQEAQRVLGTYDYGWPRLKPETIARKATGDSPLLETGALRASIEYRVDYATSTAYVGTNDPKAVFLEFGTVNMPARSFLRAAAMHKEKEIAVLLGKTVHEHILDPKHFAMHILGAVVEAGVELVKEFGADLVGEEE